MPIQRIGRGEIVYSLVCYDAGGVESLENGSPFSDEVVRAVANEPITDVVLLRHGGTATFRPRATNTSGG